MPTDNGRSGLSDPGLWAAICRAPLPGEVRSRGLFGKERHLSFRERLAEKGGIADPVAERLEEEYRRYLYLKAIDGGPLSPSSIIDLAWHLHMATPGGEWNRFCDEVLGKRLVHATGLYRQEVEASHQRLQGLYQREFSDVMPFDSGYDVFDTEERTLGLAYMAAGGAVVLVSLLGDALLATNGAMAFLGFVIGCPILLIGFSMKARLRPGETANCA